MSADSATAFYGVRYLIKNRDEIDQIDSGTHPTVDRARRFRLHLRGGQFGINNEKYYLLLGSEIAVLGAENDVEKAIGRMDLESIMDRTDEKLRLAAITEAPRFYFVYKFDY